MLPIKLQTLLCLIVCFCILATIAECKKKTRNRKNLLKAMVLRRKETNPVDFIRLTVMRVIYGIATRVGLGEQISGALNGAFVPPGVEDYDDYGGGGLFTREDDYDY